MPPAACLEMHSEEIPRFCNSSAMKSARDALRADTVPKSVSNTGL